MKKSAIQGSAVLFAIFASKAKKSMFLKDKPMGTTKKYLSLLSPIGLYFKNVDILTLEGNRANKY